MSNRKSGSRTLLTSVLMSAPGPVILAVGLTAGQSSTQIADFVRRSAELLAIVCSFVVYRMTADGRRDRARLEKRANLFAGAMMCLSGALMALVALLAGDGEKGNVIPGLVIALLGVIANTLFWRKYTRLNRQEPNAILAVQARLYRAKSLVDGCVTLALAAVAVTPGSAAATYLDFAGSLVVAAYLLWCGAKTIREAAGIR
ncbi:MAG: cation transporter [Clostridia bacterium]|nr:cation transporter [Clostridia bacterium]